MVEPQAKVCGSTSVLCSLFPFLKVSLLTRTRLNCACSSALRDTERGVRNTAPIHAGNHVSEEARIMKWSLGHRGSPRATGKGERGGTGERKTGEHYRSRGACQREWFCIRRHS